MSGVVWGRIGVSALSVAVVCAVLGIWTADSRFGLTVIPSLVVALVAAIAWDGKPRASMRT